MSTNSTEQTNQGDPAGQSGQQAPARPDGVSEEEWNALGDPGKQAILRERQARQQAESALAAARARPAPPQQTSSPGGQTTQSAATQQSTQQTSGNGEAGQQQNPQTPGTGPDFAAMIQQAVTAAVAPLQQRLDARESQDAAQRVRDAVTAAAGDRFHNPADAFIGIDVASIVDENGRPNDVKIAESLNKLLEAKPYLAKPTDTRRFAPPGAGSTPGGSSAPIQDQVKDTLARMQQATGLTFTSGN